MSAAGEAARGNHLKSSEKKRSNKDMRIALAGLVFVIVTLIVSPKARIEWPKVSYGTSSPGAGTNVVRNVPLPTNTPATLALELPHDLLEFELLIGTAEQRHRIREAMLADYVFIAGYTMFFVVFATTIANERARNLMFTLAALTAMLDVTENKAILNALDVWSMKDPSSMRAILTASSLKWFTFFFVIVCMSASLGHRRHRWKRVAALALRTAAAGGLFGAVTAFLSPSARLIISGAMALSAVAIAFTIGASIVAVVAAARKTGATRKEAEVGVAS